MEPAELERFVPKANYKIIEKTTRAPKTKRRQQRAVHTGRGGVKPLHLLLSTFLTGHLALVFQTDLESKGKRKRHIGIFFSDRAVS